MKLLFHAVGVGAAMDRDLIQAVLVETKQGGVAVRGAMFIDCSGDGDLAAWAGAAFEKGDGRGNMLYPSICSGSTALIPTRPAAPGR